MAENLDELIAVSNGKINAALKDPHTTPQQRQELGRESIRLLSKKIVGGQ